MSKWSWVALGWLRADNTSPIRQSCCLGKQPNMLNCWQAVPHGVATDVERRWASQLLVIGEHCLFAHAKGT